MDQKNQTESETSETKDQEVDNEVEHQRKKTWSNNVEYILSLFGATTGIADFWRFPYLAWRNGGGAFVFAFVCALVICAIPLYFMELVLSQYSRKSIYGIWNICPILKGVGISIGIINLIFLSYGSLIRYWLLEYMVASFTGLPWLSCNNTWNTNYCITGDFVLDKKSNTSLHAYDVNVTYNASTKVDSFSSEFVSSEEEFWRNKVLDLSTGIQDVGNIRWNLCVIALIYRGVIALCIIKSVKSIGKVMYFTTIIPVVLLLAMWIRTLLLQGSTDGIIFLLMPDFGHLANIQVWIEAVFMAFYTLGPVWGSIIVIGSHSKFHTNCLRSAVVACTADAVMIIFSSVVLFSVLGVVASETGFKIEEIVKAGMSVGFVGYTKALSYLPWPQVWTVIFFVCLVLSTLDVQIVALEMVLSFFQEIFPNRIGRHRLLLIVSISILIYLMTLPFCTQGGPYMVQILDWYHATLPILICAVLECVTFMWIYGGDRLNAAVYRMLNRDIPHVMRLSVAFVMPIILIILLLVSVMKYKPPRYGTYTYPYYVEVIGWSIAALGVLPVPVCAVLRCIRKQRKDLLKPNGVWLQLMIEKDRRNLYVSTRKRLIQLVKFNLTGKEDMDLNNKQSRQTENNEINMAECVFLNGTEHQ